MSALVKVRWEAQSDLGLPRRARSGCYYEAYVPDLLKDRTFTFAGDTSADVADAERAILELQRDARSLVDSEAVARLLLRAEAVASSRIEGLEIGGRRLLKAQLARGLGEDASDVTATEVLNNIDAMRWAVETIDAGDPLDLEHLLEIHRRLLDGTRLSEHAGVVRDQQNWIGGSTHNPCSAVFVPPPHDRVPTLLEDLCAFCSDDSLPAVTQAAIAHAQFETIHPFIDGNGRTGRALIHVVLKRRGLIESALPPVSLILATWSDDYVSGLTGTRPSPATSAAEVDSAMNAWVALFAAATTRSVADARAFETRVRTLQAQWRETIGRVRSDAAVLRLIEALPGAPVITVQSAARLIDRSVQATNEATRLLESAGVLRQTTVGRRNRGFEAPELIDAFTALERQLASPEADTLTSPPSRRVPYRSR